MKEKLALAVIVAALSGTAWAAGGTSSSSEVKPHEGAQSGASQQQESTTGTPGELSVGSGAHGFAQIDTDMDGKISEDEWKEHFSQLDANQDGKVDQSEYQASSGAGSSTGEGLPTEKSPEGTSQTQ